MVCGRAAGGICARRAVLCRVAVWCLQREYLGQSEIECAAAHKGRGGMRVTPPLAFETGAEYGQAISLRSLTP